MTETVWSEYHQENLPIVYVVKNKEEFNFWCPSCTVAHSHDSTLGEGARLSHCWNVKSPLYDKNYYVKIRPESAVSKKIRFQVLSRDGFRCVYCGATAKEATLHIDHKIPKSKGGSNELSNLVTACFDCNLGKGATL